jgi:hypothetical protein
MPPLSGWAVQYVSGMEQPDIKGGFWLSHWRVDSTQNSATFNFEPGLRMCYNEEKDAIAVSNALRENAEIETRVVKV